MALEPLTLDDLTWQQMVDAARRRIIAASAGAWTLHAPVDAGVTLLELFAWLLEQRLYLMDQVPPDLVRAMLKLLGTAPAEPTPAATVLAFRADAQAVVPEASVMRVVRRGAPLEFTADHALALVPLAGDIGFEWVRKRELAVRIPLGAAPAAAAAPLGLLFDLERSPDVLPEWAPDAPAGVPPPVQWSFTYASGGAWKPFSSVDDGTGGLRRPGIVRLAVPVDWTGHNQIYELRIRAAAASYTFRPHVLRIVGNAVSARHVRTIDRAPFEDEWLPISGRPSIDVDDGSERLAPPLPATVQLKLREARDGHWHAWKPVEDFSFASPSDRVFAVDRNERRLRFGDGLTGRIPVLASGAPNVELHYRAGGGIAGNFAPLTSFEAAPPGTFRAQNVVAAESGTEGESLDDARERVADELRRPTRAVLEGDYVEIACTTPGVGIARAHAAIGLRAGFHCLAVPGAVTVFIVPWAPRPAPDDDPSAWDGDWVFAPVPDPGALAAVRAQLEKARLLTTELCVRGPIYRNAKLTVRIEGNPRDPASLRADVTRALRKYLDPLAGFDDGKGWKFGEPLRPSALLARVENVLDDQSDAVAVHIVLDGKQPPDECSDVPIASYELVRLVSVEMDLVRVVTARGGLR
jgi:hypothetical protein